MIADFFIHVLATITGMAIVLCVIFGFWKFMMLEMKRNHEEER